MSMHGKIKMHTLMTLIELMLRGARNNYIHITTTDLADSIGKSQQAVSTHLLELESKGYIKRMRYGQGFSIKVTERGYKEVYDLFIKLKAVVEPAKAIEFTGKVVKGMGEGSYYMSLNGYRVQFIDKLGFDPYPGTLNIMLDDTCIDVKQEMMKYPPIMIEGFRDDQRTYGAVRCYKARINGSIDGAVLIPERTHHDDSIVEFVAPVKVMDALGIDYGERVRVTINLNY